MALVYAEVVNQLHIGLPNEYRFPGNNICSSYTTGRVKLGASEAKSHISIKTAYHDIHNYA